MRRSTHVTAVALASVAIALTGCSSGSEPSSGAEPAAAAWATGQEAVDAMQAAGFDCSFDAAGGGEQFMTVSSGETGDVTNVSCNGFDVMIYGSVDALYALAGQNCLPITEEDRASAQFTAPLVRGETFAVSGSGDNGAFPAEAQPDDFTTAFGGETITVLDLFDLACPA